MQEISGHTTLSFLGLRGASVSNLLRWKKTGSSCTEGLVPCVSAADGEKRKNIEGSRLYYQFRYLRGLDRATLSVTLMRLNLANATDRKDASTS